MIDIRLFSHEDHFIQDSVNFITQACPGGKGTIALSGGGTPRPIYENLPPLPDIEFFEVDERYVPSNHQDSNFKLITETLNPKRFHFFNTSRPISTCLKQYESELPKSPFDLIILGIGPDGHIASLFPRSKALKEKKRLVAHTTTDQFTVHDRLTLTFPCIMKAKKLLVLLRGKEKEKTLNTLTNGKESLEEFPAKKLLTHPHLQIHLLVELHGGR